MELVHDCVCFQRHYVDIISWPTCSPIFHGHGYYHTEPARVLTVLMLSIGNLACYTWLIIVYQKYEAVDPGFMFRQMETGWFCWNRLMHFLFISIYPASFWLEQKAFLSPLGCIECRRGPNGTLSPKDTGIALIFQPCSKYSAKWWWCSWTRYSPFIYLFYIYLCFFIESLMLEKGFQGH